MHIYEVNEYYGVAKRKKKEKNEKDPHELIWFPGYIKWRYQREREHQQYSFFFFLVKSGNKKTYEYMFICTKRNTGKIN